MKNISFSALLFIFLCTTVNAITIGEFINPLEEFLECKDLEWYEKSICEDMAQRVYSSLDDSGIGFSNGDIIITVHPVTPERQLDTGHSCTHRAWIKDNYATARLLSNGSLDFSGNSISEPLIFAADFPINLYTRVNLKETAGVRNPFNGNCQNIGTDHYYAASNVNTEILLSMSLSMEPKLLEERTPEGDYQVQIAPIFTVENKVVDTNLSFNFHGKDGVWMGFISFLTTLGSNLNDLIKDIFDGGGISEQVRDQIKQDLVYSLGSIIIEIDDDFLDTDLVENTIEIVAKHRVVRIIHGRARELEDDISAQISTALGLNADGKRTYVVDKNLVDALLMSSLIPAIQIIL